MRPDAAAPVRPAGLDGVPLLRDRPVRAGERWIYSAGCNVGPDLADTTRIDVELADLARLADAGARVAVLSHQGSHRDGTARSLEHVAAHLGRRLGRRVSYVAENTTADAVRAARVLADGEIAVFGNTRMHAGEEQGDPALAAAFARLGDAVAVGGFSKAHRVHASNVGLLDLRPGYATDSLVAEIAALAPWAGGSAEASVAVLGGIKPEKTLVGLRSLTATYDLVIPGGAVLNAVLLAMGVDVGRSVVSEPRERCVATARDVLAGSRAALHVPARVVVADPDDPTRAPRAVAVADGVPPGLAIVDFEVRPWARHRLEDLAREGGRALVAGPPGRYRDGFTRAADTVLAAIAAPPVRALLLGGDTVADLPWGGPVSTGGGSALEYLADGTCAVLDALRRTARATEETSS